MTIDNRFKNYNNSHSRRPNTQTEAHSSPSNYRARATEQYSSSNRETTSAAPQELAVDGNNNQQTQNLKPYSSRNSYNRSSNRGGSIGSIGSIGPRDYKSVKGNTPYQSAKVENNYLYIADNELGIVKIGVTKNNPYDRVESFSKFYPTKFKLVTYFNIKTLDRRHVEMFFHEILNSQFLNINYLAKHSPYINQEHRHIVDNRLNGYTELFVENKTILKNLLIFLNLIDVIDLKIYDIEEINKIKDYRLCDLAFFKKNNVDLLRAEMAKTSVIKPLLNNKQNLLLKNARYFFKDVSAPELRHLHFSIDEKNITLELKDRRLLITNFIYTNLSPELTQNLIKTKTYRVLNFKNLIEHIYQLKKENYRVSTQLVLPQEFEQARVQKYNKQEVAAPLNFEPHRQSGPTGSGFRKRRY